MHKYQLQHLFILTLCVFSTCQYELYAQDNTTATTGGFQNNFKLQTAKDKVFIGASFGGGLGSYESYSLSKGADNATLIDGVGNPKIGFFPINRLMIGGNFDYSFAISIAEVEEDYFITSATIGPIIRYYFAKTLYFEGQYGWGRGQQKIKSVDSNIRDFSAQRYSIGFGVAHFWAKRFSFELMMRYSAARGRIIGQNTEQIDMTNIGITAGLGYVFGGSNVLPAKTH